MKILTITQTIIKQAEALAVTILEGVTALCQVNPEFKLSTQQLMQLYNLGCQICIINNIQLKDLYNDGFFFEGYKSECYLGEDEGYINITLQLLECIWEKDDMMLGWWRMNADHEVYWEYGDGCYALLDEFFR